MPKRKKWPKCEWDKCRCDADEFLHAWSVTQEFLGFVCFYHSMVARLQIKPNFSNTRLLRPITIDLSLVDAKLAVQCRTAMG